MLCHESISKKLQKQKKNKRKTSTVVPNMKATELLQKKCFKIIINTICINMTNIFEKKMQFLKLLE